MTPSSDTFSRCSTHSRATLRRILIRDQDDRDAVSSRLMRYRDGHGDDWPDIVDMLTLHPDARRPVVRLLGRSRRTRVTQRSCD